MAQPPPTFAMLTPYLEAIDHRVSATTAALLACLLTACSSDEPGRVSERLPGGAMLVRNSAEGVWDRDPEQRWRLVEEVRIGRIEGEGPDIFSRVVTILEDAGGRVWVSDDASRELRVFDHSGTHIRTVGGPGDGPGELSTVGAMLQGADGRIWVDSGRRWEVFDTSGAWHARHELDSNIIRGVRVWMADGRLLEVGFDPDSEDFMDPDSYYASHTLDASGKLVPADTFDTPDLPAPQTITFTTPDGRGISGFLVPLTHPARLRFGPDGDIWLTDGNGPYTIRRQRLEGDTVLIIEREYEPVAVTAEDRAEGLKSFEPKEGMSSSDADPSRMPDVYPPFEEFVAGADSTLWVLRKVEGGVMVLDVFDREGSYLGAIDSNGLDLSRLQIQQITRDRIYGVMRDDLDVQYVVFLRIEKA